MKFSVLIFSTLLSIKLTAQSWPIHQADDPDHYYIISAEFGEIHPAGGTPPNTYPDHFHRAIDINIDGNVEVYNNNYLDTKIVDIDLSDCSKGVYLLKIVLPENIYTEKIIKQ